MAHPQTSPRGYIAKKRIDVGAVQITATSTGNLVLSAGVKISNKAGGLLTANSTGLIAPGSIFPSAGAGGAITANSTSVIVSALQIGAWSTGITVDSTGILLGSLYISCNSTGNTTT